ncbi:hypothetical protein [Streptomyces sp. NPDC060198]|uniref:hypothetical protein n=1 Tax=Streptomyces sp. NPDC060198 TaxID=3347070 RepID=UPI00365A071F
MTRQGDAARRYAEELDYLVRYCRTSAVYLFLVHDAAESLAPEGSGEEVVRALTLRLIDSGVQVGGMSPREGEGVVPWGIPREAALRRIDAEMRKHDDAGELFAFCWFASV